MTTNMEIANTRPMTPMITPTFIISFVSIIPVL